MVHRSGDLLRVVEAAYDVDASDADWLKGVAEAVRPHIDEGFGLAAFEFVNAPGMSPQIVQRCHLGIPEELAAMYPRIFATMDPSIRQRPFQLGPCVTGSQMMGMRDEFRRQPHMKRYAHRFGMMDSIWVTAADPSGRGLGIHAGRAKIAWASPRQVRRWGQIAAHLASAVRLRHRLKAASAEPAARPEAILDVRGRVVAAEGRAREREARELLRRGVIMLERARGPLRAKDPDASLDAWKALVSRKWTLVDTIDHDGRRFIVARENEPAGKGPPSLTARERQVVGYARLGHYNKLIAYELGIAHSTVRVLLARAATKLGVRTREELLRVVADDHIATALPTPSALHGFSGAQRVSHSVARS